MERFVGKCYYSFCSNHLSTIHRNGTVEVEKQIQKRLYQNETLSERIEKLYLKSEIADAYFTIKSNCSTERVPIHKSLLAAVSDVFKAMFYGDSKEDGDVKIPDVTAAALKEFLQFFYLGRVELTEENVVEVMHLGHKYNVIKCVDVCVQFLKDTLTDENFFIAFGLAILYEQNELIKLCEKRISVNTNAMFKSNGFLECDKRALAHILKNELLSCSETEVFEACMSWVKAQSNQDILSKELVEAHLGDLIYEIRFKSMTIHEFAVLPASYDSVLSSDFKEITNLIAIPELQPTMFNQNPRQVKWNAGSDIKCKQVKDGKEWTTVLNNENITKFSTNESVLLGGFTCEKIVVKEDTLKDLRSNLLVFVEIIETTDPNVEKKDFKVISNLKASLGSKETEIMLPIPVLIRPGFKYTISISQFQQTHFSYMKELMEENQIDSNIKIKFYINYIERSTMVGLVSTLMFNKI